MKIVICDDEKIYVDKVYDIVKKYCENDEISVLKMLNNC